MPKVQEIQTGTTSSFATVDRETQEQAKQLTVASLPATASKYTPLDPVTLRRKLEQAIVEKRNADEKQQST
jgi:hypothetical protein